MTDDGRYVIFELEATNLVADDTNRGSDVFVRDRTTGKTFRVSVDTARQNGVDLLLIDTPGKSEQTALAAAKAARSGSGFQGRGACPRQMAVEG